MSSSGKRKTVDLVGCDWNQFIFGLNHLAFLVWSYFAFPNVLCLSAIHSSWQYRILRKQDISMVPYPTQKRRKLLPMTQTRRSKHKYKKSKSEPNKVSFQTALIQELIGRRDPGTYSAVIGTESSLAPLIKTAIFTALPVSKQICETTVAKLFTKYCFIEELTIVGQSSIYYESRYFVSPSWKLCISRGQQLINAWISGHSQPNVKNKRLILDHCNVENLATFLNPQVSSLMIKETLGFGSGDYNPRSDTMRERKLCENLTHLGFELFFPTQQTLSNIFAIIKTMKLEHLELRFPHGLYFDWIRGALRVDNESLKCLTFVARLCKPYKSTYQRKPSAKQKCRFCLGYLNVFNSMMNDLDSKFPSLTELRIGSDVELPLDLPERICVKSVNYP